MAWLLLTHAVALALLWYHPKYWISKDLQAFEADGSKDSLKQGFHAGRLWVRCCTVAGIALACSLPCVSSCQLFVVSFGGLVAIGGGWFFCAFNAGLSKARGLDPYYLSKAPDAALWPDRLLSKWGIGLKPVMRAVLFASLVAYAAAVAGLVALG